MFKRISEFLKESKTNKIYIFPFEGSYHQERYEEYRLFLEVQRNPFNCCIVSIINLPFDKRNIFTLQYKLTSAFIQKIVEELDEEIEVITYTSNAKSLERSSSI